MKKYSDLSKDERTIIELLKNTIMSSSAITNETGFGKTKVVDLLNKLIEYGYIQKVGNDWGTKDKAI